MFGSRKHVEIGPKLSLARWVFGTLTFAKYSNTGQLHANECVGII